MKLRSICPVVKEGIAWDDKTDKLDIDLSQDRTQDVIKLFNGLVAYQIIPNIYACLRFEDEDSKTTSVRYAGLSINLTTFHEEYIELLNRVFNINIGENDYNRSSIFFDDNDVSRRAKADQIRAELVDLARKHKVSSPENLVDQHLLYKDSDKSQIRDDQGLREITKTGLRLPVLSRNKLESALKGSSKASVKDAQGLYKKVRTAIMDAINGTQTSQQDPSIEGLKSAVMDRFNKFRDQNILGFTPDLVVRTVSKTNRPFFDELVGAVGIAGELNANDIRGVAKRTTGVTYDGHQLVVNGHVNPHLPDTYVGRYMKLQKVAENILKGNFKITGIYPDNRHKLGNLFGITDDLDAALNKYVQGRRKANILFVDDSTYSGSTVKLVLNLLRSDSRVGNVAGYVILKA